MLLSLLLLVVAQEGPKAGQPTTADAPSAVRFLFQAGDLRGAVSMCRTCAGSKKAGFKECTAMLRPLVEYQALIGHSAELKPDEVKALLEYEHAVSPEVPSKLSGELVRRFVDHPWQQAQAAQAAGDPARAAELAQAVLRVLPSHAGALELLGRGDAGHGRRPSRDAGR